MNLKFGYTHSALVACFAAAAGPAWADLTAQDVWSDWRGYLGGMGYEISASEKADGGTLTVSDLTLTMPLPDVDGALTLSADTVTFAENGDGTVAIGLPATMPVMVSGTDEGESFEVQVNFDQTGHTITASGSPAELTYAYAAATMAINLASVTADGADMSEHVAVQVLMNNVTQTAKMTVGDIRSYTQRMTSDGVTYNISIDDPESDDGGAMNGSLASLGFEGAGTIPNDLTSTDMRAMLDAGFAFDGTVTYGPGQTNLNGTGDGDSFQFASSSQGGSLDVAMDSTRIAYGVTQNQTAINVAGSEIPFPIALELAEYGFKLLMPVAQTDEEQDFALSLTLGDFTMSDMIWGIFDGGGVLPRDPATIAVDLAGKVKVLADFLAPDFAETVGQDVPGELHAMTINNLLVSAVGAELSGAGDFTFDNTDLQTFGGMPKPTGAVDLKLVGANGLIDKLIQMGFVSDQDAMGARMMMGMLAVPGEGEDTLTSKIEMNAEGHIIANGQRIQ